MSLPHRIFVKTDFIALTAHQLRIPLTSIRWFSEMLMAGDVGPLSKAQLGFVERIYQDTERMIHLVNLLLQIARVEAGKLKVKPVPLDLRDTTQEVVDLLKISLAAKSQKVAIQVDPDPFPLVSMDREVIYHVIQNLLSNANRYSPKKSVIEIAIMKKGNEVEYSVKDHGIGIPKRQQRRIFEKFFRADNALKLVSEGSGLGLFLVKSFVEGWGGKIFFESVEGKGTTFFFTIPAKLTVRGKRVS